MKERRKDRRWAAVVSAAVLLALLLLSGCSTKRVTEYREVHDTLKVTRIDTTYITRHVADTVRQKDSVLITLKESGDTMRVEVWRDRWKVREVHDTLREMKTDTIYQVQVAEKEREVVKQSWWERVNDKIAWACFFAVIIWLIYRKISLSLQRK